MKKVLFAALMVYGLSLASCDKGSEATPEGKLVDVTLSSESPQSRTWVTASGVTRWSVGDEVFIVDTDKSVRPFKYTGTSTSPYGQFKGQLLDGKGEVPYYAFYGTSFVPCTLGANNSLSIAYKDLTLTDPTATALGKHCPMVAIPLKFDAAVPMTAGFQFHHATHLNEAIISCSPECELNDVDFDKVVYELRALKGFENSFNSKVTIDLKAVKGKPENDVDIPYAESDDKLSALTTTLNYSTVKNLGNLITGSETGGFSIPIFALPTKAANFNCEAIITFYNGAEVTCILHNDGKINTLKPAGLNQLKFGIEHRVQ